MSWHFSPRHKRYKLRLQHLIQVPDCFCSLKFFKWTDYITKEPLYWHSYGTHGLNKCTHFWCELRIPEWRPHVKSHRVCRVAIETHWVPSRWPGMLLQPGKKTRIDQQARQSILYLATSHLRAYTSKCANYMPIPYTYIYTHAYIHIYTHTHTRTNTHIYIFMHTHTHLYTHIYPLIRKIATLIQ